ncbi:MAG TPA: hypothetical protein DCX71_07770, partial [Erythrobacter sp.]|nr:hypothetical protein [Erythrobacter sp.]
MLASTSVHAQVAWTVSETDGRVAIRDENGERPARRGAKIAAGGAIETGANGSAVIVREREFVTVRPNSRVKVPKPSEERSVIQIVQDWGSAVFNIGKQPDPHFGVRTPTLAAVVKGTSFSITVDGSGSSMQVTEGAVEVWTGDEGARDLVTPGEVAMVGADDPFRLTIMGDETRTLDSPARDNNTPSPTAAPPPTPNASDANTKVTVEAVASEQPVIETRFVSGPRDLEDTTEGLVSGEIAAVTDDFVADLSQQDAEPDPAPAPELELEPRPEPEPEP